MKASTLQLDRISRFLIYIGTAMAIGCNSILVMASAYANDSTGYIATGANWANPIGKFKLTVERDPDELVSFCWNGDGKVKKVGPTTFEIRKTNFVPTHDFDMVFIMN